MTATNGITLKRLCGNIAAGRFDRETNKLTIDGMK